MMTEATRRALGLLAQEYQGSVSVAALVTAIADQCQEVDDALNGIKAVRAVETATGGALDALGTVLGVGRESMSDTYYRYWLRAAVLANVASGTTDEIQGVMQALYTVLGGVAPMTLGTKVATITLPQYYTWANAIRIARMIGRSAVAGTRTEVIARYASGANTLKCDGTQEQSLDYGYLGDIIVAT